MHAKSGWVRPAPLLVIASAAPASLTPPAPTHACSVNAPAVPIHAEPTPPPALGDVDEAPTNVLIYLGNPRTYDARIRDDAGVRDAAVTHSEIPGYYRLDEALAAGDRVEVSLQGAIEQWNRVVAIGSEGADGTPPTGVQLRRVTAQAERRVSSGCGNSCAGAYPAQTSFELDVEPFQQFESSDWELTRVVIAEDAAAADRGDYSHDAYYWTLLAGYHPLIEGEYRGVAAIAPVDAAGNEGPLSDFVAIEL